MKTWEIANQSILRDTAQPKAAITWRSAGCVEFGGLRLVEVAGR